MEARVTVSSTAYEIPLSANPQTLAVTLAGVPYNLRVLWNADPNADCWVLDIYDVNDNPIVTGIPMVTGEDLLSQYAYLGIGGSLYVQTDNDTLAVPTFTNLGSTSHLYFVVGD